MSQTVIYSHTYNYRLLAGHSGIFYPLVPVELLYGKNAIWRGDVLLDSGANYPVFDAEIAERLGINLKKSPRILASGLGGYQMLYQQKMGLRIGPIQKPLQCIVCFIEALNKRGAPNVIGRIGVFDHLKIGFDEAERKVYIAVNV